MAAAVRRRNQTRTKLRMVNLDGMESKQRALLTNVSTDHTTEHCSQLFTKITQSNQFTRL